MRSKQAIDAAWEKRQERERRFAAPFEEAIRQVKEAVRPRFDYATEPVELVPHCNLCGPSSLKPYVLCRSDRYGLKITSLQCPICGLVWFSPRMTPQGYKRFYESGAYREFVSKYQGVNIPLEHVEHDQRVYARQISRVVPKTDGTVLDVGGSAGLVGKAFGKRVTLLEPAIDEAVRAAGCEILLTTLEEWEPKRQWDLILCCRVVDHWLDIKGNLRKLKRALAPGGKLWIDAVQWVVTASQCGCVEGAMKLDHPFGLMEGNLRLFLEDAGFEIVKRSGPKRSVGFLCQ